MPTTKKRFVAIAMLIVGFLAYSVNGEGGTEYLPDELMKADREYCAAVYSTFMSQGIHDNSVLLPCLKRLRNQEIYPLLHTVSLTRTGAVVRNNRSRTEFANASILLAYMLETKCRDYLDELGEPRGPLDYYDAGVPMSGEEIDWSEINNSEKSQHFLMLIKQVDDNRKHNELIWSLRPSYDALVNTSRQLIRIVFKGVPLDERMLSSDGYTKQLELDIDEVNLWIQRMNMR